MKKVLVIGSSGSGKSTFARRLCGRIKLPLIHLDKLYWKPNWVETTETAWREIIAEILCGDEWIIDGGYSNTLEMRLKACDTAIWLDLPNYVCTWRVFKRFLLYRPGNRPDMAEGCHEKFDWKFLKWTWNYPARSKPKVEALLRKFEDRKSVIRLNSNAEIEQFFMNLPANKVKSA